MQDPKNKRDDGPNKGNDNDPQPPMPRMNRSVMMLLVLIALGMLMLVMFSTRQAPAEQKTAGELINFVKQGAVTEVTIGESRVDAELREGTPNAPTHNRIYVPVNEYGAQYLADRINAIDDSIVHYESSSPLMPVLIGTLPWILLLLILWFFLFRSLRGMGGGGGMLGNFGRSKHKVVSKEMTHMTLNDVAGVQEAKDEVAEIVEFLKNPKKFQRLGGRIPRGVLLLGEPGCGKTLLAKAVAGEAEVPFFSISGSDFVEMFVGVGASRVRDLFKQAKESSPCIIFLDEIDAVGRKRGSGFNSGGHDEREQTLNAILVEMDGFESNDQVIVMAATNRADVLDPALTRPGRFDRQIAVPLPDVQGRFEILKVHAKKIKMGPDVELERLARSTPMFSGADLAAIINEAAIIATLENKDFVEQVDLEEARDKVRFGRAQKSRKIDEDEKVGTAYHEAGHAVVEYLLPHADPVHKVTIIPRGQSLGSTMSLPEKDRYGYGIKYLNDTMRVLCGGRIAENRKTGDVTSGAAMDIRMATRFARHMVLEWGMSERLGFVDYISPREANGGMPEKNYSEQTARIIDEEVKRLVDEAFSDAEKIIEDNWERVVAMAEALLKYETLTADEVQKIMTGQKLHKPTVSELLDAEAARAAAKADEGRSGKPATDGHGPETDEGGPLPSPA